MTDVDLTQLSVFSTPTVIYCSHNLPFGLGATLNTERFAYLRMLIELSAAQQCEGCRLEKTAKCIIGLSLSLFAT